MRLDIYLTENNIAKSRERAKLLIKNGNVYVNDKICTKPAYDISENDKVICELDTHNYVGRGLIKLETAFQAFDLDISNKVCADIGASTGGFTQCMLRKGAKYVYAIDVGHGQLDESLVNHTQVKNCEGVNARYLTADFFDEHPEFMSVDLSFISLTLVMPALVSCLKDGGEIAALIKPQFEAGKSALNKKGIVKNRKDHIRVLEDLFTMFQSLGLEIIGAVPSSIKGGDGNIEYLVYLKKRSNVPRGTIDARKLADSAFALFTNTKE